MGFLTPVAALSRCIYSPANPQGGSARRVLVCVASERQPKKRGVDCVALSWSCYCGRHVLG